MGEVTTGATGLLSKIGSLFNNKMFSDVEFLFLKKNTSTKLYGHKLILALRSDYFASSFYRNKEAVQEIVLPTEEVQSFYVLLRFLYTDDIQFQEVEVENLYTISKKYGVEELSSKCLEYLLKQKITIDNIFSKYECALSKNIETLLRDCRNFVCHEAESVFKSICFEDVPMTILEDIIKQDDLSLSSEIIAINAVLRWAKNKCKKDQLPVNDKNLKECIYPLLKYLRFLTLSATEFQSIVEKYNIFTGLESTLLTCKMLQPESNVNVPDYICSSNQKRGKCISNTPSPPLLSKQKKYIIPEYRKSSVSESKMENEDSRSEPFVSRSQISSNTSNSLSDFSNNIEINRQNNSARKGLTDTPQKSYPKNFDYSELLGYLENMNLRGKHEKEILPHSKLVTQNDVPTKAKIHQSSEKSRNLLSKTKSIQSLLENTGDLSNNPKLPQPSFQYEIKKPTPFAGNTSSAHYKGSRGQSTQNVTFGNFPCNFSSDTGNRRTFEFCLIEGPQSLLHSFRRDIKCSVTFLMKSGSIDLYGLELYVKNGNEKAEKLEVDVDLNGFSGSFTNKTLKKSPVNNIVPVMFSSPVLLEENSKGEVEISIDSLFLNRCRVCPSDRTAWKLSNGTSCIFDISIKSNQYFENQNSLYFLINRLFYNPH